MALLPSVSTYVSVELTRYRSAVSEFLAQTLGKSINYLLDKTASIETAVEGANISFVQSVSVSGATTATYAVPAGNVFIGTISGTRNSTVVGVDLNISAGSYTGLFGVGATGSERPIVSVPQVVSGGSSITGNIITGGSSPEVIISGFIFSTTTITIP